MQGVAKEQTGPRIALSISSIYDLRNVWDRFGRGGGAWGRNNTGLLTKWKHKKFMISGFLVAPKVAPVITGTNRKSKGTGLAIRVSVVYRIVNRRSSPLQEGCTGLTGGIRRVVFARKPSRATRLDQMEGLLENSNRKTKLGRNKPCHCGSGRKFKHCHGGVAPRRSIELSGLALQQELAREYQRERQQGLGKPIISTVFQGRRCVAVGSRLYYSLRWKTFYDFLWEFMHFVFGKEWFAAEAAKPVQEQHPVLHWHRLALLHVKSQQQRGGEVTLMPKTGAIEAYFRLAYNLYVVSHNGNLPDLLVHRLKLPKSFRGAEHELYVAATFNLAGFTVEFEDETDEGRTHCEYTVTHRGTGRKFSVEAKARDVESTLLRGLLTKALTKQADYTRLVWFAINAPASDAETARNVLIETLNELRSREGKVLIGDELAPPAYVVVSNTPFSFALESTQFTASAFAEGFQIPDFKFDRQFTSVREARLCRERHQEIHDLFYSMQTHKQIPATFDGEDEAFAYERITNRLLIGATYPVPHDGNMIDAILENAVVSVSDKMAHGFYRTSEGNLIMASCPLTSEEIGAYLRSPKTFFGVLDLSAEARTQDPLELYDWLYKAHRNTTKEKLLEWMRGAGDQAEPEDLSQRELAVIYCERCAESIACRTGSVASACGKMKS